MIQIRTADAAFFADLKFGIAVTAYSQHAQLSWSWLLNSFLNIAEEEGRKETGSSHDPRIT